MSTTPHTPAAPEPATPEPATPEPADPQLADAAAPAAPPPVPGAPAPFPPPPPPPTGADGPTSDGAVRSRRRLAAHPVLTGAAVAVLAALAAFGGGVAVGRATAPDTDRLTVELPAGWRERLEGRLPGADDVPALPGGGEGGGLPDLERGRPGAGDDGSTDDPDDGSTDASGDGQGSRATDMAFARSADS